MPNHKSAEKRDRQNARRNAVNTANRSRLRSELKKLRAALAEGDAQAAQTLLPLTIKVIDKAIQKGVLHRKAAARHKSRLTLKVNALAAAK
jgi:small subunit ribosomal protein S20